jgi:hypothetical protein
MKENRRDIEGEQRRMKRKAGEENGKINNYSEVQ